MAARPSASSPLPRCALAPLLAFLLASCSLGSEKDSGPATREPAASRNAQVPSGSSGNAVLYGIGLSTDPYGESRPQGFGVASGLVEGHVRRIEVRGRELGWFGGPFWVGRNRIVVPRNVPPLRPPLVFGFRGGKLERLGPASLRPLEPTGTWSPDGKLVATEPI